MASGVGCAGLVVIALACLRYWVGSAQFLPFYMSLCRLWSFVLIWFQVVTRWKSHRSYSLLCSFFNFSFAVPHRGRIGQMHIDATRRISFKSNIALFFALFSTSFNKKVLPLQSFCKANVSTACVVAPTIAQLVKNNYSYIFKFL